MYESPERVFLCRVMFFVFYKQNSSFSTPFPELESPGRGVGGYERFSCEKRTIDGAEEHPAQRSKMALRVEAIAARLAALAFSRQQALRMSSEVTCPLVVLEPGFPTDYPYRLLGAGIAPGAWRGQFCQVAGAG